ncbi:MAG: hypothetical protein ACX94C_11605 [Phycisphaerales bacterium]
MLEIISSVSLLLGALLSTEAQLSPISPTPPSGPTCQSPPDGSTQDVEDCFDDACDKYRAAWNACGTPACKNQATVDYITAINLCVPTTRIGQSGWATIWYAGDSYGVAFDTDSVPDNAYYFTF